jgi:hypothetical protein
MLNAWKTAESAGIDGPSIPSVEISTNVDTERRDIDKAVQGAATRQNQKFRS